MPTNYFSPDFDEEQAQLTEKRKLMELLQQKSMQPMNLPNPNARASWLNALVPMVDALAARKQSDDLDKQRQDLAARREDRLNTLMDNPPLPTIKPLQESGPVTELPSGRIMPLTEPGPVRDMPPTRREQFTWNVNIGRALGGEAGKDVVATAAKQAGMLPKPPSDIKIHEFYTPEGKKTYGVYDDTTGTMKQVGGAAATAEHQPPALQQRYDMALKNAQQLYPNAPQAEQERIARQIALQDISVQPDATGGVTTTSRIGAAGAMGGGGAPAPGAQPTLIPKPVTADTVATLDVPKRAAATPVPVATSPEDTARMRSLEKQYGLPDNILTHVQTLENSGDTAVSPAKATGRFQIMPVNVKKFSDRVGRQLDPRDPVDAQLMAALHLSDAMDQYKTSDPRVLVADYNGGPIAANAVRAGKQPPQVEAQKYLSNYDAMTQQGASRSRDTGQQPPQVEAPKSMDPYAPENIGKYRVNARNAPYLPPQGVPGVSMTTGSSAHAVRLNTDVAKLGDDMTKLKLPELRDATNTFNQTMRELASDPKNGIKLDANGMPTGNVPGLGGPRGVVNLSPIAPTATGQTVRSALAPVVNIILNQRSGAAVSDQELRRYKEEMATSFGSNDAQFYRSWNNFQKRLAAIENGVQSGYAPIVVDSYRSRGASAIPSSDTSEQPTPSARPRRATSIDSLLDQYAPQSK